MRKLSVLFALMMTSSVVIAGGAAQGQALDDSTTTQKSVDNRGLFSNPYMPSGPTVDNCDYSKNKLWFGSNPASAPARWHCVNDRTKTGEE